MIVYFIFCVSETVKSTSVHFISILFYFLIDLDMKNTNTDCQTYRYTCNLRNNLFSSGHIPRNRGPWGREGGEGKTKNKRNPLFGRVGGGGVLGPISPRIGVVPPTLLHI